MSSKKSQTQPTLEDIARKLGVSTATVSRALHLERSPNVGEETRLKVQRMAHELGYQPNLMGRSLVKGRSHTVSYWTLDAFSPYYVGVARTICEEAARRRTNVIINSSLDPANTLEPFGAGAGTGNPIASSFDGIIACDVAYERNAFAQSLRSLNIPFVGIGMNFPPDRDYVALDFNHVGVLAVRHLLEQGCRRIAHVTTSTDGDDARAVAYADLMTSAGHPVDLIHIRHHHRKEARERLLETIQKRRALGQPLPDALFCINDETAIGCYRALCDLGIAVPAEMLIVGCDGIEDTKYHACPLSTVVLPVEQMCSLAWDFLENRIQNPQAPLQQVTLQPELVVRQSALRSQSEEPRFTAAT